MGSIGSPEKSVLNQPTLSNITEEFILDMTLPMGTSNLAQD
jgi:hypothetical protein